VALHIPAKQFLDVIAINPENGLSSAYTRHMPMPQRAAFPYVAAIAAVVAATALRALLNPLLEDRYPFAFYFVSIVVAGWIGGLWPALVALVLGYLAADWFFLHDGLLRFDAAHPPDWGGLTIYLTAGLAIAALAEAMRRTRGIAQIKAQRLHEHEKNWNEAQGRLAAIVESSDDAIISKNLNGIITSWNLGAERIFGYTADETIGKPVSMLAARGHEDEMSRILTEIKADRRVEHFDTVRRRKDGREINVSLTVSPIRDPDGRIIGASKIARDITERIAIQSERESLLEAERAARAEADRANRMKDEFLSTVSHEIRTPLNAILGWAQILRTGKVSSKDFEQGLEIIERNSRAQAQLIEDLLDMSRIITGRIRLDVQRVDLAATIESALTSLRPAAQARGIQLEPVLDRSTPSVNGDPVRLNQIVWNLLSNAIKFTAQDGTVKIVLDHSGATARIVVADTGQGIDPGFLPFVFDRFRQEDSSTRRQYGGLGLGLAIVKQLVELHGGQVRAESPGLGQGATFSVTLPIKAPTEAASEIPKTGGTDARPSILAGLRVLVVDDDGDARALVERILRGSQADVTTAASAREAMDRVRQERPDVLLSDIGMPEEDGYDLIRKVRSLDVGEGGAVPAAALTAFARSEDRRRALMAGYQTHVSKPVEPAELLAVVASLAGRTASWDMD
jgi:PAS domain S-box-containing protein